MEKEESSDDEPLSSRPMTSKGKDESRQRSDFFPTDHKVMELSSPASHQSRSPSTHLSTSKPNKSQNRSHDPKKTKRVQSSSSAHDKNTSRPSSGGSKALAGHSSQCHVKNHGSGTGRPAPGRTSGGASEKQAHPLSRSSGSNSGSHQRNYPDGQSDSSRKTSSGDSQEQSRSSHHRSHSHGQPQRHEKSHPSGRTSGVKSTKPSHSSSTSSGARSSHGGNRGSHSGGETRASSSTQAAERTSSSTGTIWPFKKVMYYLDGTDDSRLLDALTMLRKYHIKQEGNIERLRRYGGVGKLLNVIETSDDKILDLAFSVLGNCCMEKSVRTEILSSEGIPAIVGVLKATQVASIQARVGRTLGNLALDLQCAEVILDQEDAVYTIVQLAKTTEDGPALITYGRTLRLLGCSPASQKKVLADDGLKALGELLKHEDKDVAGTALKGIIEFTKSVTPNHALQLVSSEVPASLLDLCHQTDRKEMATAARSLLLFYMEYECMRPAIGNAGGITYLMECIAEDRPVAEKVKVVNCLCLCCQEVVNRVKIKAAGGLKVILDMMANESYQKIHSRIISALICYMYDDEAIEVMMQAKLVPTLLTNLRRVAGLPSSSPDWRTVQTVLSPGDRRRREEQSDEMKDGNTEESQGCRGEGSSLDNMEEEPRECGEGDDGRNCDQKNSAPEGASPAINDDQDAMEINVTDPLSLGDHADRQNVENDLLLVNLRDETDPLNLQNPSDPLNLEGDKENSIGQSDPAKSGSMSPVKCTPTRPKYSIDSPSYQAACRAHTRDHYRGPCNMREAQDYYGISPERVFLGGSPLDGDQYSPLKVVVGRSPSLGGMSPLRSMYEGYDIPYPVTSSGWSSSYSISPNTELSSPIGEPAMKYTAWGSPEKEDSEDEYSSEESCETESQASQEVAASEASEGQGRQNAGVISIAEQVFPLDLSMSTGRQSAEGIIVSDRGQSQPSLDQKVGISDSDEVGEGSSSYQLRVTSQHLKDVAAAGSGSGITDSANPSIGPDSATPEGAGDEWEEKPAPERRHSLIPLLPSLSFPALSPHLSPVIPDRKRSRNASSTSNPAKRLHLITEARRKSQTACSSVSSPGITVEDLQTPPCGIRNYLDTLKDDEHITSASPRRMTENYILVLLSRFSVASDLTLTMLSTELWDCLFQYLALAYKPLPRASRIMQRMTRNQACLEHITQALIPAFIHLASENMDLWWRHRKLKTKPDAHRTEDLVTEINSPEQHVEQLGAGDNQEESSNKDDVKQDISDQNESQQTPVDEDCASAISDQNVAAAKDPEDQMFLERKSRIEKLACDLLQYLALIAESYYGRGQLSHHLLAADSSYCLQRAISIAFICRSSTLRRHLFINCKGLDYLLEGVICGHAEESLRPLALRALSHLAAEAGLSWPLKRKLDGEKWTRVDMESGDVCFDLRDDVSVKAQRATLIERSPVFRAMLEGNFAEASKSRLSFQTECPEAFRILISYLHGYSMADMQARPGGLDDVDFLELLELADQYNEGDIEPFIPYACESVGCKGDAKIFYDVAVDYEFPKLGDNLILYLLTGLDDANICLECWEAFSEPATLAKVIKYVSSLL